MTPEQFEQAKRDFAKKWGHERTMNTMGLPVTIPKYDEFLADLDSLSLPPAEGAEEILKKYLIRDPISKKSALEAMHEFATLHAQKIADKMVEERIILDEEMAEPVQDALYATGRFTIDECNVLTEGILMYIKERGIINLKSRESHG